MSTHTVAIITWRKFLLLTFNFLYHLGFLPAELSFQANLNNFPLNKKTEQSKYASTKEWTNCGISIQWNTNSAIEREQITDPHSNIDKPQVRYAK